MCSDYVSMVPARNRLEVNLEITKPLIKIMSKGESVTWPVNFRALNKFCNTEIEHIEYCKCRLLKSILEGKFSLGGY